MITKEIKLSQKIVNNANYMRDFTISIGKGESVGSRYVVSSYSLYVGINPSLQFDLLSTVDEICEKCNLVFDSIGGWLDEETNLYHLDANLHFDSLDLALKIANVNNQISIFDKVDDRCIYL